ncbi:CMRF35-like molecule 5 [Rhineura floridana]|uniref:CMRF35-like molecule 5 n=1 Tax=Rhineura floridana TaxID=261503 RepID=UPI002AC83503|nr:CMRF35-like molecule 5 [Rhineura floridana]
MRLLRTISLLGWLLFPGCMSSLRGPAAVTGFLGRSLSVMCHYDDGYQTYYKYWCKGASWKYCSIVVGTTGTEAEAKAGTTSIKDDHIRFEFTMRLKKLTMQDAGIYWCAIERKGIDLRSRVDITVLPAPSSDAEGKNGVTKQPGPDSPINTAGKEKSSSSLTPTKYLIYESFLISISLKIPIFLCLIFAIIWMHRRHHQERASVATLQENVGVPVPQPSCNHPNSLCVTGRYVTER